MPINAFFARVGGDDFYVLLQNTNLETAKQFSKHLLESNIIAHPLSKYFRKNSINRGLVMGYSSVNNKVIKETIDKMKKCYVNFLELS